MSGGVLLVGNYIHVCAAAVHLKAIGTGKCVLLLMHLLAILHSALMASPSLELKISKYF